MNKTKRTLSIIAISVISTLSLAILPANAATNITPIPNKLSSFKILKANTPVKTVTKKTKSSAKKTISKKAVKKQAKKSPSKKKVSKKPTKRSMSIKSVKNVSTAKKYLSIYCPRVKVGTQKGIYSTYNPSNATIKLGTKVPSSRYSWVFAHEFGHHLQWSDMNGNVSRWNKNIRNKSLEVQGDYIAQILTGGNAAKGHYTQKKPKGKSLIIAKAVIKNGKKRGC